MVWVVYLSSQPAKSVDYLGAAAMARTWEPEPQLNLPNDLDYGGDC